MSGVLQPVGPEPARTYWIRRGILLAVVAVLILMVVLAVSRLTTSAVATSPPPVIPPAAETASPTPTTGTPPASGTPAPSSSAGSTSASPVPSGTASSSTTAAPRSTPTPTATVAGTPDCQPADLRVTLKGDERLAPGENNTFTLSVINGGDQTCLASVTAKNFELKIYSGTDRIWSSRDCTKALTGIDKKLAAEAAVGWKMAWNGERSVAGKNCATGDGTPKAGTYFATAQLKGADPVQLRMIIS